VGRIAIHELFIPNDHVQDMIVQGATLKSLREAALKIGMRPLHMDGVDKVASGITTIDEILRVANVGE
jgi:type II secretory ATPase GspE/PulE/Tfp pilus assembly ATPase PilB-like protein